MNDLKLGKSGLTRLAYVTTYSPSEESLGGASWVDRSIVGALAQKYDLDVLVLANRGGTDGKVRLEVRRNLTGAVRTFSRMLRRSEPYFSAKFRSDTNWRDQVAAVKAHARRPGVVVVTSQLPALLAVVEAGVVPALHIAHNVDTVLAKEHDPLLFRILNNAEKMQDLERRILATPSHVAALSTRDSSRLRSWGIQARHWPLSNAAPIRRSKTGRIGFLGKATWPPNIAAIEFLLDDVMPLVREKMGRKAPLVVLAGRGTSRWSGRPGVTAVGEVVSAKEFYSSVDLVSVPRMGEATGVSVKMLEAVSVGVPVIVPPELASDAGLRGGFFGASTAGETAEKIIEYYDSSFQETANKRVSHGYSTLPPWISDVLPDPQDLV